MVQKLKKEIKKHEKRAKISKISEKVSKEKKIDISTGRCYNKDDILIERG